MPSYKPTDVLPVPQAANPTAREGTLSPGLTAAHLAATYLGDPSEFPAIMRAAGLLDPVPFVGAPPRHLRRYSLVVGQRLILPEGDLL